MHSRKKKISKRLILYIILFSSLITAFITLIQLYYEYSEDKMLLDTNIKNINTGYRDGITNAIWLDDKEQLVSILDGVVALPDIEYIEVRVNSKIYAARGRPVNTNSVSSSFPLRHLHDGKTLTIGETYVEADLSAMYQRLINHAWAILALNGIKTFFVAIFMYLLFDRLVVSRLESLSRFVRNYDINSITSEPNLDPIMKDNRQDEIMEIAAALKSMQVHLAESVKELLGLKTTLDLSMDGVIMFHPETYNIFYANAGAVALLGYTEKELLQMKPVDISADLTGDLFTTLSDSNVSTDNQAVTIETLFRHKDEMLIPVRLLLQYLHPENEAPRFVFMARDITEHIEAQKDIRNSLDEANAANTELESFSYSISHDLRAPLRSIDGFSLLLLHDYGDKIDDEGKGYIERVRKNAQHMGLLIDDMLSLSNVTRGELNRDIHSLSDMAAASIKKWQDYEPERHVTVDIIPGIYAWVDKALFENLMDNLIGNAWKYTGKTKDAHIEFGSFRQGDETVYFVRDNGAGFDMQYANKLFNAFHRLHKDDDFEGTGIGLATVSRILSRHGGRIWAEAEVGKGACFYFTVESEPSFSPYSVSD